MPLMDKATKGLLTEKLKDLVEEIDLNPALWNELTSRKVVTKTQKEDIVRNERNTSTQQKTELLSTILPKRGQEKFVQFCLALVATDQDLVVTEILGLDLDALNQQTACEPATVQTPGDALGATTACTGTGSSSSGASDAPPHQLSTGNGEFLKRSSANEDPESIKRVRSDSSHESEGEEMELTDSWGLKTVPVRTATDAFYQTHSDPSLVYPMYLATRGLVLIINVSHIGTDERRGTEVDCAQLTHLFKSLHFEVVTFTDRDGLTANEIYAKVKDFFQHTYHNQANCAAMVLLSHGVQDVIFGTDGNAVKLDDLYLLMNNCPGLDNKPKLVFLEACAGLNYDDGRCTQTALQGHDEEDAPKLPYMTDFFIGRPSQPGMRAHRNTVQGSWYVQAIVKVFTKYAAILSLPELIIKVNAAVAKKESHSRDISKNGKKQAPDGRLNLRRNLYFFPGIQRTHP